MMITKYNAPNETTFLQSNLAPYKVMAFDMIPTKTSNDQDKELKIPIPRDEIVT